MQKRLTDYDLFKIYKKWYSGCGTFECFVHSTSFVSLKHYPDFTISDVPFENDGLAEVAINAFRKHSTSKVLCFIDLPETISLKVGFSLHKFCSVKPILTIRHIQHPFGIVGDYKSISQLLQYGEQLSADECENFVFVLDSLRYDDYNDEVYKVRFNNQYELTEFDLPPLEMLTDMGYEKLLFMYQEPIKKDIEEYLEYMQSNGIVVVKVVL